MKFTVFAVTLLLSIFILETVATADKSEGLRARLAIRRGHLRGKDVLANLAKNQEKVNAEVNVDAAVRGGEMVGDSLEAGAGAEAEALSQDMMSTQTRSNDRMDYNPLGAIVSGKGNSQSNPINDIISSIFGGEGFSLAETKSQLDLEKEEETVAAWNKYYGNNFFNGDVSEDTGNGFGFNLFNLNNFGNPLNSGGNVLNSGGNPLNHGGNLLNSGGNPLNNGGNLLNNGGNLLNNGGNLLNNGGNLLNGGGNLLNSGGNILNGGGNILNGAGNGGNALNGGGNLLNLFGNLLNGGGNLMNQGGSNLINQGGSNLLNQGGNNFMFGLLSELQSELQSGANPEFLSNPYDEVKTDAVSDHPLTGLLFLNLLNQAFNNGQGKSNSDAEPLLEVNAQETAPAVVEQINMEQAPAEIPAAVEVPIAAIEVPFEAAEAPAAETPSVETAAVETSAAVEIPAVEIAAVETSAAVETPSVETAAVETSAAVETPATVEVSAVADAGVSENAEAVNTDQATIALEVSSDAVVNSENAEAVNTEQVPAVVELSDSIVQPMEDPQLETSSDSQPEVSQSEDVAPL